MNGWLKSKHPFEFYFYVIFDLTCASGRIRTLFPKCNELIVLLLCSGDTDIYKYLENKGSCYSKVVK